MYFRGSGGEAGAHEWGSSIRDLEKTVTSGWQSFFCKFMLKFHKINVWFLYKCSILEKKYGSSIEKM